MIAGRQSFLIPAVLLLATVLQVATWLYVRDTKGAWLGVPPVPGTAAIGAFFLGDRQFAYRASGIMLQNLGETGGYSVAPDDYDFTALKNWFLLADTLDPRSNFAPFLASYYYSTAKNPDNLGRLLDYLYVAGTHPGGHKWRWLAQGVYIARFEMHDLDTALKFAKALAALNEPGMPAWTRQMPAFILNARGDREEALSLMIEMLKSNAETMHPNELNFTRDYICGHLLDPADAKIHPLCGDIP
jgi:hypothetical protein